MRLALISLLMIPPTVGCNGDEEKPVAEAEERREGTEPGDCNDDADNDGDGLFDCKDDGCAGSDVCTEDDEDTDSDDADTDNDTGTDTGVDPDSNPELEILSASLWYTFSDFPEETFIDDCQSDFELRIIDTAVPTDCPDCTISSLMTMQHTFLTCEGPTVPDIDAAMGFNLESQQLFLFGDDGWEEFLSASACAERTVTVREDGVAIECMIVRSADTFGFPEDTYTEFISWDSTFGEFVPEEDAPDTLSDDPAAWSCHPVTQEPCDVEAGEACDYSAAVGEDGTVISEDFVCHPPPNDRLVGEECGPDLGWCEAGATCNLEADGSNKCREWCFSTDDCPSPKACVLGASGVDWLGTCDSGLPYDPASLDCDPITQEPCDVEAGEACDLTAEGTTFTCFPPPNDVPVGEPCGHDIGYCVAGATCMEVDGSGASVCRSFCLYDEDCEGSSTCEISGVLVDWVGTCTLVTDEALATCSTVDLDESVVDRVSDLLSPSR